jgi:ABC-type Fe3+-siderophore transport system permease subunit
MNSLARKLVLILYIAIAVPLFVNYLMEFGWFGRYGRIAFWAFVALAALVGSRLKSRAEKKAESGEVVVEALDAQGAVRSDPRARRYIWQTVSIAAGIMALVILALAYRDRNKADPLTYVLVAVAAATCAWYVFGYRFGNISDLEGDDGVTMTFRRGGQTTRVPWSQVESVEVSRPYAFWQVMLRFRHLGDSKVQTVRFLPLGWRKMTPASAEKLQSAMEQRRQVQ